MMARKKDPNEGHNEEDAGTYVTREEYQRRLNQLRELEQNAAQVMDNAFCDNKMSVSTNEWHDKHIRPSNKLSRHQYVHEEWNSNPYETTIISLEECRSLIDVSLIMKDESWFKHLTAALNKAIRRKDDLVVIR